MLKCTMLKKNYIYIIYFMYDIECDNKITFQCYRIRIDEYILADGCTTIH